MTYRVAASVLEQMFPVDAGKSHETLRTHTLKLGEQLQDRAVIAPTTAAPAIAISVDSTFIRSCEDGNGIWRSEWAMSRRRLEDARFLERSPKPIPTSWS
jgi:hypothetical protein